MEKKQTSSLPLHAFISVVVFLVVAVSSGCQLKGVIDRIFLEEDLLRHPPAERCFDCHKDIYREWEKSRHAVAWESDDFIRRSKNRSDEDCLPCHAPRGVWGTTYTGEKGNTKTDDNDKVNTNGRTLVDEVILRDVHHTDGVYCVSCHFWEGGGEKEKKRGMVGPYDVWSPPHPSFKDEKISKSEFCGVCHEKTFEEWKKAGSKKMCQECHMPDMGRKYLTQKPPISWLHSRKMRNSHEFPSLIAKKEDIRVDVKKGKDRKTIIVVLENIGIPHNLPTADFGRPRLYVDIEYGEGKETFTLSPHMKNSLRWKTPVELVLDIDENENIDDGEKEKKKDVIRITISRKLSWSKEAEKIGTWEFILDD